MSAQNYKIYINEVEVILTNEKLTSAQITSSGKHVLHVQYLSKVRDILNCIDMCEKGTNINTVYIHFADLEKLWDDFKSLFTINTAAGGLVENEKGEFLFFFRRGNWDLPKGKTEKGETKKQTAIREVEEETGLTQLVIQKKITVTYHTFKNNSGNRILKESHWYHMNTHHQKTVPQASEDIEKIIWCSIAEFKNYCTPAYRNIHDVVDNFLSQNNAPT
jgi:8-oxo-dGTP pyrophosphatase MutT (NUDIX family)